jgi:hypothetical protein
LVLLPLDIFACACCAERGFHSIKSEKLDGYLGDEISRLSFGSATLYSDAGYPDTIAGIDPLGETLKLNDNSMKSIWDASLIDDKARKASLSLVKPAEFELFMTDREPLSKTTMVTLYKEIRFDFKVGSASGFLEKGIDPETKYRLILQGTGNACTSAPDFKSYVLQIRGKNAGYSFYGALSVKEDMVMQTRGDLKGDKPVKLPPPTQ